MEPEEIDKYVNEVVWLPTYLGVALIVLVTVGDGALGIITMLGALIGTRVILEFLYRKVFKEKRLKLKTGVIAFMCQILAWGGVLFFQP